MEEGWKRNGTGLEKTDFFVLFQLKGVDFYVPVDSDGLFEDTIFDAAKKNGFLIPSLGDIVDYVNIDSRYNGKKIINYLRDNFIVTSVGIEKRLDGIADVEVIQSEENIRINRGLSPEGRRFMCFDKCGQDLNLENINDIIYEEKNIVEIIFNRKYSKIMSALDGIVGSASKIMFLPDRTYYANPTHLTLLYDGGIHIRRHNICNGKFCMH